MQKNVQDSQIWRQLGNAKITLNSPNDEEEEDSETLSLQMNFIRFVLNTNGRHLLGTFFLLLGILVLMWPSYRVRMEYHMF